jgi:hypothetical protein
MEPDPPNRLPDAIRDLLTVADHFELLSLDPENGATREPGHFWGWRVLGSVVVGPGDRDALVSALERGIAENGGWVAACFIPRHGIRASRGAASVDLVVCFECAQVYIIPDGKWSGSVLVTDSPQPAFDRVLSAAGVPLAEPRHAEPDAAPDPDV